MSESVKKILESKMVVRGEKGGVSFLNGNQILEWIIHSYV